MEIKCKNIRIGYQKILIQDINFQFTSGNIYVITGKNGEGKTCFVRTLAGLTPVLGGEILHDIPLQKIGFLNHFKPSMPNITVEEYLSYGIHSANQNWIQKLNIDKWLQKSIHHLSDGEFKKVALCRQLLKNPQLLILDEPTNFLDRENKRELGLLLQEIKNDCVVIVVSHDEHFYNSLSTEYVLEVKDCNLV